MRVLTCVGLAVLLTDLAFSQSDGASSDTQPVFEAADVHVSAHSTNPFPDMKGPRPAGMGQGGGRGGRGGDSAQPSRATPEASDPGGGLTLLEAAEKQLGLKLELQKRPVSVLVIDHVEQKPTDN
jgi:hypothetical protein